MCAKQTKLLQLVGAGQTGKSVWLVTLSFIVKFLLGEIYLIVLVPRKTSKRYVI